MPGTSRQRAGSRASHEGRPACSSRRRRRRWQVTQADCFNALAKLAPETVDVVVTDPPYGIGFNGLAWDRPARLHPDMAGARRRARDECPNGRLQEFSCTWGQACLAVLKPGAHIAAFGGSRTVHRLTCGLEDAGYEIRDVVM